MKFHLSLCENRANSVLDMVGMRFSFNFMNESFSLIVDVVIYYIFNYLILK